MRRVVLAATLLLVSCGDAEESESPSRETTARSLGTEESPVLELVAEVEEPVDAAMRFGDDAVYLVSRTGMVMRLVDGSLEPQPALDITDLTTAEGEQGLLGLDFAPNGSTAYLNYTDNSGDTQIVALSVNREGVFDRSSMRTLLTIEQPYANHNGGDLVVEPSGTVLVATGDGGSGGDPDRVALDDSSLLGKVLRVDPDTGETTLLARGLRNPWRVDLHDDRLWLADVGQGKWEEVSVIEGVSTIADVVDFGWSAVEGNERFNDDQESLNHVPPVMVYEHGDDGCSISGGAIAPSGALAGQYVFADYCSGRVWSLDVVTPGSEKVQIAEGLESPVAVVRVGPDLMVLTLSGEVFLIVG